jgi:hypothetical protein
MYNEEDWPLVGMLPIFYETLEGHEEASTRVIAHSSTWCPELLVISYQFRFGIVVHIVNWCEIVCVCVCWGGAGSVILVIVGGLDQNINLLKFIQPSLG